LTLISILNILVKSPDTARFMYDSTRMLMLNLKLHWDSTQTWTESPWTPGLRRGTWWGSNSDLVDSRTSLARTRKLYVKSAF